MTFSESFKEIFITLLYACKSVCTHVLWIQVCTEVRRQVVGVILYFHYVRPEKTNSSHQASKHELSWLSHFTSPNTLSIYNMKQTINE